MSSIVRSIKIDDFRGLKADVIPPRVLGLFGPNGTGKTNFLDALDSGLTGALPRADPLTWDQPNVELVVDADDELMSLFLHGGGGGRLWSNYRHLSFGADTGIEAWEQRLLGVDEFLAGVRNRAVVVAERSSLDWASVSAAFTALLDAWLDSRVLVFTPFNVEWPPPTGLATRERLAESARLLVGSEWRGWIPVLGRFIASLVESERIDPELIVDDLDDVFFTAERSHLVHVTRTTPVLPSFDDLAGEVTEGVRNAVVADMVDVADEGDFDGWLEDHEGWVRVRAAAMEECRALAHDATLLAPAFAVREWRILAEPVPPQYWHATMGQRVRLRLEASNGTTFDLATAGSGVAIWAAVAVREALLKRREETGVSLLLADEPEAHLHPNAQRDVASWLVSDERPYGQIVFATHAPSLLDAVHEPRGGLLGMPHGFPPIDITADLLGSLDELADELGVIRSDCLQAARQFVFVEGVHDKAVVERLFAEEIAQARAVLLPMHGVQGLKTTLLEYFARLELPMSLLCDSVREDLVLGGKDSGGQMLSSEEKQLRKVLPPLRQLVAEGFLRVASFPEPDILTALPEAAVARFSTALGGRTFEGWNRVKLEWEDAGRPQIKDFVVRTLDVATAPTQLVPSILEFVDDGDQAMPSLAEAISQTLTTSI